MATRGGFFKAESHNGDEFMGRTVWIKSSNPNYGNNNNGGYNNQRYNNNGYNNNNYNNNNYNNNSLPKKSHPNQSQTIFVGNLSWNSTPEMLTEVFEASGKVAEVRIGRKPDGRSRGFAYVEFENEESAKKALEMTNVKVDGREINIDASFNKSQNHNMNNGRGGNFNRRGGNFRGNRRGYY